MKKLLLIIIIFMSTFLMSFSQIIRKDSQQSLINQNIIINNQKIILKNQDTIKQNRKQDTLKVYDTLKMSDIERKKLEYFEYQRKEQQMNKNLKKMDEQLKYNEKETIKLDSVFQKRGIK